MTAKELVKALELEGFRATIWGRNRKMLRLHCPPGKTISREMFDALVEHRPGVVEYLRARAGVHLASPRLKLAVSLGSGTTAALTSRGQSSAPHTHGERPRQDSARQPSTDSQLWRSATAIDSLRRVSRPYSESKGTCRASTRPPLIYSPSQDTWLFQSTNAPLGLSRHAQTCSSKIDPMPYRFGVPTNWKL